MVFTRFYGRTDSRTHSQTDRPECSMPPAPFINGAGVIKAETDQHTLRCLINYDNNVVDDDDDDDDKGESDDTFSASCQVPEPKPRPRRKLTALLRNQSPTEDSLYVRMSAQSSSLLAT